MNVYSQITTIIKTINDSKVDAAQPTAKNAQKKESSEGTLD
jgi:hypothetical protein